LKEKNWNYFVGIYSDWSKKFDNFEKILSDVGAHFGASSSVRIAKYDKVQNYGCLLDKYTPGTIILFLKR
jgi:hypothetical protein